MKKQLLKLSAIVAGLFLFAGIVSAQHTAPYRTVVANHVAWTGTAWEAITIDGQDLEDSYGAQEDVTWCWNPTTNVIAARDLGGYIKICYDEANLYVFAHVTDDSAGIYDGNGSQWTFDNVEVFMDMDTTINLVSNLGAFDQAADGAATTDANQYRWDRGIADSSLGNAARNAADLNNFALSDPGTYWNVEVALPFLATMPEGKTLTDLAEWVNTSATIGFDVSFADNDSGISGDRTGQLAWEGDTTAAGAHSEADQAWHDTRTFGFLQFGSGGCAGGGLGTACGTKSLSGKDIEIFPNPVKEVLTINNLENAASIDVINVLGQRVKSVSEVDAASVQIRVSDLAPGTYQLKFTMDNGDFFSKTFIR
jgi:hypothetical protein